MVASIVIAMFNASASRRSGTLTQTGYVPLRGPSPAASMWAALSDRTTALAAESEDAWSNLKYTLGPKNRGTYIAGSKAASRHFGTHLA